jgi:cyclophilin family peptidyl-prolyl cis-trans isomerase
MALAPGRDPHLRLQAVAALGAVGGDGTFDALVDLLGDPSPLIRAAVLRSLADLDRERFITILSALDEDVDWRVRAALAAVLGTFTGEFGLGRLRGLLADSDARVVAAAIAAAAARRTNNAATLSIEHLKADDPVVRAAAATALATLKPSGVSGPLLDAYRRGEMDTTYVARAAVLAALAANEGAGARPLLTTALTDQDWAVRVRAAALLKELDASADTAAAMRPALPLHAELYEASRIVNPEVSPQAYIETTRGTIHVELAVLDAPLTAENFTRLARAGFFDGQMIHRVVPNFVVQAGDPRGDGEGGPGYTIRDELNQRPYLRGTVGMALDWADTGGSQFFITLSPQPHLDARYTAFGRVLSGMDVADAIEPLDVIQQVRIWDGTVTNER